MGNSRKIVKKEYWCYINVDNASDIESYMEKVKKTIDLEKDVVEYKVESFWIPVRGEQSQFTILIHYDDGEMISCPTK